MPTTQEILELILKIPDVAKVQALADQLGRNDAVTAALKRHLEDLTDAYHRGAATGDEYRAGKVRLEAQIAAEDKARSQLTKTIEKEAAAAARASKTAADSAASSGAGMGKLADLAGKYRQNLTALGYAVQDFASTSGSLSQKLNSVANNIPGILAGAGGLGIAISAILPLVTMLAQSWGAIFGEDSKKKITQFSDTLKGLQERLEQLKDKKIKVDMDFTKIREGEKEIDRLKEKLDSFEAAKHDRTSTQQAVASQAKENVAENAGATDEESGAANLQRALATNARNEFLGGAEALVNHREALQRSVDEARQAVAIDKGDANVDPTMAKLRREQLAQLEDDLAKLRETLDEHVNQKVAAMVGGYRNGIDADRQRLADIIDQAPDRFASAGIGPQFRASLVGGSADAVRNAKKEEQQQARDKRGRDLERDRTQKALEPIQQFGEMDDAARQLAYTADQSVSKGQMTPEQAFQSVSKGVNDALAEQLKAKNIVPDRKALEQSSKQIATKALEEVKQSRLAGEREKTAQRAAQGNREGIREAEQKPAAWNGEAEAPQRPSAAASGGESPAPMQGPARAAGGGEAVPAPVDLGPRPLDARRARDEAQSQAKGQGLSPTAIRAAGTKAYQDAVDARRKAKADKRKLKDARLKTVMKGGRGAKGPQAAATRPQGIAGPTTNLAPAPSSAVQQAAPPRAQQAPQGVNLSAVQQYFQQSQATMAQQQAVINQLMGMFQQGQQGLRMMSVQQRQMMMRQRTNSYPYLPEN